MTSDIKSIVTYQAYFSSEQELARMHDILFPVDT